MCEPVVLVDAHWAAHHDQGGRVGNLGRHGLALVDAHITMRKPNPHERVFDRPQCFTGDVLKNQNARASHG